MRRRRKTLFEPSVLLETSRAVAESNPQPFLPRRRPLVPPQPFLLLLLALPQVSQNRHSRVPLFPPLLSPPLPNTTNKAGAMNVLKAIRRRIREQEGVPSNNR